MTSVSTASLNSQTIGTILDLQSKLVTDQKELSSGTYANMSDALGFNLTRDYTLGFNLANVNAISSTNKIVTARLDTTANALSTIAQGATSIQKSLITALNTQTGGAATLVASAQSALDNMIGALNTSDGSEYVFSGINASTAPIANFVSTPASAAKQALDQAFQTAFGMSQSSSNVSSITPTQMQNFINGPVAALFSATNWSANWSSASSQPLQDRILASQTIQSSVTANDPAFQKLAMGYAMLSDLPLGQLSAATYQTVIQAAQQNINDGVNGVTGVQANVGLMQAQVNAATQTLCTQQAMLTTQISDLESVDPTTLTMHISNLTTQI